MIDSLVRWTAHEQTALVTESGHHVSYAELQRDVDAVARQIPAGQLVFLMGANDRQTITAYLACLSCGAVALLLGRDLSRQSFCALVDAYQPHRIIGPDTTPVNLDGYRLICSEEGYAHHQILNPSDLRLHADLCLLLATSGSTGSPKLVRLSSQNLISNARSIGQYLGIDAKERAITSLPFHYSYGLSVINSHLHAGATVVLSDRSLMESSFWKQMQEHQVTSLAGVPYSYEILLKLRFQRMSLPHLKTLTQAGGRLDREKIAQIHSICREKGMRFFTMYGQTEATARIAYLDPEMADSKLGSIGRPIPGGQLAVLSDEGAQTLMPGQVGELVYSGPNVALGYAESRSDLALGDQWHGVLRTGDMAHQDADGYFFLEGRKHRFLKIFGVRIALDAVEAWLSARGISGAAHGRDDLLCVSLEAPTAAFDAVDCKQALVSAFGLHPTALTLNVVEALPRLATGKVDYPCLNTMC